MPAGEPTAEPMFGRAEAPAGGPAPVADPDAALVQARLRHHHRDLEACATQFYARAPEEGALKVDLRVAIAADGRVTGVEVHGAEAVLDQCLCDRLYAIDYRGVGAATTLRYPLWLSP